MYNLLKQKQQHYSPFTAAMTLPSASSDTCTYAGGKSTILKTGWVRCDMPCRCTLQGKETNCGDGKSSNFVYCPSGKKCAGTQPKFNSKSCTCNSCPWAFKVLPSNNTVYNSDGKESNCAVGKQKLQAVCSYKLNSKYCSNNSKPADKERKGIKFTQGCGFNYPLLNSYCDKDCKVLNMIPCRDGMGNASDANLCYEKLGKYIDIEKTGTPCKGGLCKNK